MVLQANDYYREKYPGFLNAAINPELQPPEHLQANEQMMQQLIHFGTELLEDGPKMPHRGKIVHPQEVQQNQQATLAGSITRKNGQEARAFEWNNKSQNNLLSGFLDRHAGAHQQPDRRHLEVYKAFVERELDVRAAHFNEIYDHEQFLLDYPRNQT